MRSIKFGDKTVRMFEADGDSHLKPLAFQDGSHTWLNVEDFVKAIDDILDKETLPMQVIDYHTGLMALIDTLKAQFLHVSNEEILENRRKKGQLY